MTGWAALAAAQVRDFATRHGLHDLGVFDFRDIDPAQVDHAPSWQEHIDSPSTRSAALTLVLLGERVGTPLAKSFAGGADIARRLQRRGIDWVHVAGVHDGDPPPEKVPLTGTLYEYFDAFLGRTDGGGAMRVVFKGREHRDGEPDFGNGEYRAHLDQTDDSPRRKRELRKDYQQQLDWLNTFWERMYASGQHVGIFCPNTEEFLTQLEHALIAEFLAPNGNPASAASSMRIDPMKVSLPGPAAYDLEQASYFLGRSAQVTELAKRVFSAPLGRRLVVVSGDSGAGKSSLLRAGLLNDARSPTRLRAGWRTALLPMNERPAGFTPLQFLLQSLVNAEVLPELGPFDAWAQRLDGITPAMAAQRLVEGLDVAMPSRFSSGETPKLVIIVDQIELVLDTAQLDTGQAAAEATAFLEVVAVLGGAVLDTAASDHPLERVTKRAASTFPCCVVAGLPADRLLRLSQLLSTDGRVFALPRLVDETAIRSIVTGTFDALGLSVEPAVIETMSEDALKLAYGSSASVLPLLAVALATVHDGWKRGQEIKMRRFCRRRAATDDESKPGFDCTQFFTNGQSRLDKAIEQLGNLAWDRARQKLLLRQTDVNDQWQEIVLARLLRRLVVIGLDDDTPDRLTGLPERDIDADLLPLADALREHRLLTRHSDGMWWLVHQVVLRSWSKAAVWREAEKQPFRTLAEMVIDHRRWQDELRAGETNASRWLWTRRLQIQQGAEVFGLRGFEDSPTLAAFFWEGVRASAQIDSSLAGYALRVATFFKNIEVLEDILNINCSNSREFVNEPSAVGERALVTAAYYGSVSMLELLLRAGADPLLVSEDGQTALMAAAGGGHEGACQLLMRSGSDLNHRDRNGLSALSFAIHGGHADIVNLLLALGADPHVVHNDGSTALFAAARSGHDAIVEALILAGLDANDAAFPLKGAALSGSVRCVALLLSGGAEINRVDATGFCAMHYASQAGNASALNALLNAGADRHRRTHTLENALHLSAAYGHDDVIEQLLKSGLSPHLINGNGMVPLLLAAGAGHEHSVVKLIAAKAEVDVSGSSGYSALMLAVKNGHGAVARRLLASGCDVNHISYDGSTAMIEAVWEKDIDLVELLLQYKPNMLLRDRSGFTAFEAALFQESDGIIELFLAQGMPKPTVESLAKIHALNSPLNMELIVNARGKMCLVHDRAFWAIPLWVGYHVDKRQLEIIFETGDTYPIDWAATDEMDGHLLSIDKILIIRMRGGKPVEGYSTSFLKLRDNRVIE